MLSAAATVVGCGVEYPCANPIELEGYDGLNCFSDPAVKVNTSGLFDPTDHEPYLELGFYEEQLYEELREGDDCPIAPQSQGGVWAMPALRTLGVGSPTKVTCSLIADTGEPVSETKQKIKMYLQPGGSTLEFQQFPIRIREADTYADVEDLFGVGVELKCHVEDSSGRAADAAVNLVFTKG